MFTDSKNYEFIPPEGGWGYVVLCGIVIPVICAIGSVTSFGLIFCDFLIEIGAQSDTVAVITSFFFITLNFSGLITNILSKRFSKRSIVLLGSFLYILGSILTVFVTTKMDLLISYGLLQGAGFGFMTPISFAVFNSYFIKRRSLMMSIASTVIGFCITLYPILVQFLISLFGYRGCLLLLVAINMHTLIAMLVMHPFEWHSKRVLINKELSMNININTKILPVKSEDINSDMETEMGLIPLNSDTRKDSIQNRTIDKLDHIKSRGLGSKIVEFLDLNLMKDSTYVNIALGMSFATYSDAAFISFQPSYLMDLKYTNDDVATIIASGLGTDLISRIVYSFASAFIQLKSRDMFLFGVIFMLVARIAFMYIYEFTEVLVINGIIGFFRAWIYITPNLIFAECLPLSRFASGFGLFMFLQGIIIVILGIFISWIHSIGQSYTITFYVLHAIMLLCIAPWIIEMILVKLHWAKN